MTGHDSSSASLGAVRRLGRLALGSAAGVAISVIVLLGVSHAFGLGVAGVAAALSGADRELLLLAFLGSATFHVLVGAHKMHLILRSMGVSIPYAETLRLRLGMDPLRLALPLRVGELGYAIFLRSRERVPLARGAGMTLFDRFLNLFGAVFWVGLGTAFWHGSGGGGGAGLEGWRSHLLAAVGVGALLVTFAAAPVLRGARRLAGALSGRLGRLVDRVTAPLSELSLGRKLLLLGYGVLFQARPILVCWALLAAHGVRPGIATVVAAGSVAVVAGQLPGPIAGAGPREATLVALLSPTGASSEALLSAALAMTLAVNVVPALVGLPWSVGVARSIWAGSAASPGGAR